MLLFVGIHNASYLFGIPMMVQVQLSPSSNWLFITQLRVLKACRLILKIMRGRIYTLIFLLYDRAVLIKSKRSSKIFTLTDHGTWLR